LFLSAGVLSGSKIKKKRRIYKKLTNLFFFSFAHRGKICNRPTLAPACLQPFARAIFNISFPLLP
jgi:hypothetical protein